MDTRVGMSSRAAGRRVSGMFHAVTYGRIGQMIGNVREYEH